MPSMSRNRRCGLTSTLLLQFVLLVAVSTSCQAESMWQKFLNEPTASSRDQIAQAIARCEGDVDCRTSLRPTSAELRALISLVDGGQPTGLEVGFLSMSTLVFAGGDYNDLLQALSGQIGAQPRLFLSLVKANYREPKLLTKMPSSSVDDPARQVEILQERISALERVSDPSLADERAWALDVLRESAGATPSVE